MDYFGTGKTIKEYRNALGATQKELANERLSANIINILESGRKRLTVPTALILAENINEIARKKKMQLTIGIKDLMISNKDYTHRIIRKKLDEIKLRGFDDRQQLDELIKAGEEYELYDLVYEISSLLYEQTFKTRDYESAISYLLKLVETGIKAGDIHENIVSYNRIGTCYYLLNSYDEAIRYLDLAYREYEECNAADNNLMGKIIYNLALCYNKIGKHDRALIYVEELSALGDVDSMVVYNAEILKSNIYSRVNDNEASLRTLENLLDNPHADHILYHNYADSLYKMGRKDECIVYLEKAVIMQVNKESPETTKTLLYTGRMYKREKRYLEAGIYLNFVVNNAIRFNQSKELEEAYELFYEIFAETGERKYFERIADEFFNVILKTTNDYKVLLKAAVTALQYFMITNQNERGIELASRIKKEGG